MDTGSLYIALSHISLEDGIKAELKKNFEHYPKKDCSNEVSANSTIHFLPRTCGARHIKHNKREFALFKEKFCCTEKLCLCSKTYCCFHMSTAKTKFSSKVLSKWTFEEPGAVTLEEHRRVLSEKTNVQSTYRGFRTVQHSLCTYGQTKGRLSYFYRKRIVLDNGTYTKLIIL